MNVSAGIVQLHEIADCLFVYLTGYSPSYSNLEICYLHFPTEASRKVLIQTLWFGRLSNCLKMP